MGFRVGWDSGFRVVSKARNLSDHEDDAGLMAQGGEVKQGRVGRVRGTGQGGRGMMQA